MQDSTLDGTKPIMISSYLRWWSDIGEFVSSDPSLWRSGVRRFRRRRLVAEGLPTGVCILPASIFVVNINAEIIACFTHIARIAVLDRLRMLPDVVSKFGQRRSDDDDGRFGYAQEDQGYYIDCSSH